MADRTRFDPVPVGVNATVTLNNATVLGGFLCKTAGTLSITTVGGAAIVSAFPVAAGQYVPMPFYLSGKGASVVTAGGASGTLATA